MKRSLLTALAAAASAFAVGAAQFSFEGRWLSGGAVQADMTTTCTVRFYASENASSATATQTGVPLKTDSEGYFVMSCESPSSLPDVFWAGITPEGKSEISPRTKVAPVPFTLSAVKAELVKDDTFVEFTGTATIDRLETTGNVRVEELTLPMGSKINVRNFTAPNVYVDTVSLANGCMFGLFNAGSGATLTPVYDSASYEYQLEAKVSTKSGGFLDFKTYYYDTTKSTTFTAGKDGFVIINVKSDKKECPYGSLTLSNGSIKLINGLQFGTEQRLITVPCRKGETFQLELFAKSADSSTGWWSSDDDLKGWIKAKVKFVYFGL